MSPRASATHAESLLVAAGRDPLPGAPLNRPLIPASNFLFGAGREYSRNEGTPSWEALEEIVGGLEDARAVSFSSGMAGVAAVFDQLAVGAKVAIPSDCYQGVAQLAAAGQTKGIWSVRRIAVEDTAAWLNAAAYADLIWLESPSNPLLAVGDLRAVCAAERKPGALVAVDNTFATALNQRPLDLGADIAFQSATKFIGGHSDLLSGVLTVRREDVRARLLRSRSLTGATPGALESFLAVRGARTMAVRLERAQQNAAVLAERLQAHPRVSTVRYPGLPSHPSHGLAREQLKGFGSMLSFDVRGSAEEAEAVCTRLRLVHHTTSLGAVESTIERRARNVGQEHLPPTLLRLSVGIEHVDDLWADLRAALEDG
jgi:cystathionine gamma-synthase